MAICLTAFLAVMAVIAQAASGAGLHAGASDAAAQHFRAALQAQRSGRFDVAASEYQEAIRLDPELAEAYANLGLVDYLQSKFKESSEALAQASHLKPGLRGVDLFLGMDYVRLNLPKRAIPYLDRAAKDDPANRQARLSLGTALWNAGETSASLQELRETARLFPTDIDVLYALGEAYQKSASFQLEKLPSQDAQMLQKGERPSWTKPDAASSGACRQAWDDFDRKDYSAAESSLTAFLAANPASLEARYLLARTYEQLSLGVLSRMFQADSNSYRVHQLLGRIDEDRWQNEKALAEFRTVEQMRPALPGIHLAIGEVLWREGKLDPALAEFAAEIKLSPYDSRAFAEAGTILVKQHKSTQAIPYLTKALQLQPDQSLLHKQLGIAYYQQKKYARAIEELEKAAPRDGDGSVHFLLGAAYRDSGHLEQAKAEMAEARSIQAASERQAETASTKAAAANAH